jgi:polypeptide N-acetylgalactosaminyltransferase
MNRPDLKNIDIGNLTNRLAFRSDLQCQPFDWYLDNVYPQKFIIDSPKHVFAYGRVRNSPTGYCIDTMQNEDKVRGQSYIIYVRLHQGC